MQYNLFGGGVLTTLFNFGLKCYREQVRERIWHQPYGDVWYTIEIENHVLNGWMLNFDLDCLSQTHAISSGRWCPRCRAGPDRCSCPWW